MKTALSIGLTALLVGALAFYGGVMYGKSTAGGGFARNGNGFVMRLGQGQRGQGQAGQNGQNALQRFRGGFAGGEIIGSDAKSITVKSADGSTRTVYFDSSTRVVRSAEATISDLAKGSTVIVVGASGSDGSITARSVQIVPKGSNLALFGGGMRGFGAPGANAGQGAQNGQGGQSGGGQTGDMMVPPPDGGQGGPPPGL